MYIYHALQTLDPAIAVGAHFYCNRIIVFFIHHHRKFAGAIFNIMVYGSSLHFIITCQLSEWLKFYLENLNDLQTLVSAFGVAYLLLSQNM